MSKKLKPCPFCGSKPLRVHSALNEYHSVAPKIGCSHCRYIIQAPDLAIDMNKSVKENCDFEDQQTISYWNARPAEDALKAENERLKSKLALVKEHLIVHRDHAIKSCRQDGKTFHVMNEFLAIFCNDLLKVINTDQKEGEDE